MIRNTLHAISDRAKRFAMPLPLHFRKGRRAPWLDAQIVNISHTGILFRTDETFPAHTSLEVRVDFPESSLLECQCRVVRTEPSLLAVQIQRHKLIHF
jgi:hypothetical protein